MLKAAEQDIKDQTLWVIANMERSAAQAVKQATEQKKSGWAVMSDLATMYGEQKAIRYRKWMVEQIDLQIPAVKVVDDLMDRVKEDVMMWSTSRSTNPSANVIADEEHGALLQLLNELRNSRKHLQRTVAIESGLGMDVLKNQ